MSVLIDTNVLVRIAQVSSPDHETAKSAVLALSVANVEMCLVPQVIYEFWVVATRPIEVNGLGMDVPSVMRSVGEALQRFHLRKDERGIYTNWQALVVDHDIKGKGAHDARLVAAMQRHGLVNLITFNKPDFARFAAIQVHTPAEIVSGRVPT